MQPSARNETPMSQPTSALEEAEYKRCLNPRPLDESLSEFERARQSSKTWSMGQD
jgi:exonuclease VII small subunit